MSAVAGSLEQARAGRYALHGEIASGGMATVHLGKLLGPVGFSRTVAIKRLLPPLSRDPEFVASLLDEARLAARIRHPNVVPTLDVVAAGSELLVVMEFVLGESLAGLMRVLMSRRETVPVPIAAAIAVGVLHGLHAAHETRDERGEPLGIVHRDVSPQNILVGIDGAAHVIDFGVAKARGRTQVTRDGVIKGKLGYMPPEQLLGRAVDRRADVFAASIVLWEALSGRRLFQGIDDGDLLARVLHGPIDPPSKHARGIDTAMDAIVLRGLSRDVNRRYATARDMALAIEESAHLAPPSRVADWVESLARAGLAQRMNQLTEVERCTPSATARSTSPSSAPELIALARDAGSRTSSHGWPRRRAGVVVAAAALAMIGAAGAAHLRAAAPLGSIDAVSSRESSIDVQPLVRSPQSPAAIAFPVASQTMAIHSPAERRSTNHATVRAAPWQSTTGVGSRSALGAKPESPAAAASTDPITPAAPTTIGPPDCNPPFWYDADGTKRYNRRCAGR